MLLSSWKSIVATGLLASVCTGCASLPTSVIRGQSPEAAQLLIHEEQGWKASNSEIEQIGGERPADLPLHGEVKGVIKNNLHPYEVSKHGYKTPVGPATYAPGGNLGYAGGYNPYQRWGNFDGQPCPVPYNAGFGNCPPNHQELCWDHGGRRHAGQYHYHTYRYKAPNCPVYPAPNQPGGVVTYPYYTHKGPSDFFMK
ncbi:MAG: hypothetical protein R3C12_02330 [Planctomycetaceae bacterium]|nr:hypothetical protein [Planctomycetaceae bacterium]